MNAASTFSLICDTFSGEIFHGISGDFFKGIPGKKILKEFERFSEYKPENI